MDSLSFIQVFQIILIGMYLILSGIIVWQAIKNTLDADSKVLAVIIYVAVWACLTYVVNHVLSIIRETQYNVIHQTTVHVGGQPYDTDRFESTRSFIPGSCRTTLVDIPGAVVLYGGDRPGSCRVIPVSQPFIHDQFRETGIGVGAPLNRPLRFNDGRTVRPFPHPRQPNR